MVVLVGEVREAQRAWWWQGLQKGYEKGRKEGLTWPWNRPMNMETEEGRKHTNVAISVGEGLKGDPVGISQCRHPIWALCRTGTNACYMEELPECGQCGWGLRPDVHQHGVGPLWG